MKKLLSVLVVGVMMIGLTACGSGGVKKVCKMNLFGITAEYTVHADSEDGDVTSVDMLFDVTYLNLGIDPEELSDEEKEATVSEFTESLDLGSEVETEMTDEGIIVTTTVQGDAMSELGSDLTYKGFIEEMETFGATCE